MPTKHMSGQQTYLGVLFTAILVSVYFGFVILTAFAPALLAEPVLPGGIVNWAFAYGFFVMALGVCLTGFYVFVSNRAEARRAGAPQ